MMKILSDFLKSFLTPKKHPGLTSIPLSWYYQLQSVRERLDGDRTYLVVDPYDISADKNAIVSARRFSEMRPLRRNAKVLAYLSIGEAEDYRPYWPHAKGAEYLDKENPNWKGNYKVKFWKRAWKDIVYVQLKGIVNAGFDGVYLDIIDAYEYYDKPDEMVQFVLEICATARAINPNFLVFPQNGDGLLWNERYLAAISGIGCEDIFFGEGDDGEENAADNVKERIANLALVLRAKKPVLSVEYGLDEQQRDAYILNARKRGYIPLVASRDLDASTDAAGK